MKKERSDKNDAFAFLNGLVTAKKLMSKKFTSLETEGIHVSIPDPADGIMIRNLEKFCALLEMPYQRVDWDGNEHCRTSWDKIFFVHKGIEFYELVDKLD